MNGSVRSRVERRSSTGGATTTAAAQPFRRRQTSAHAREQKFIESVPEVAVVERVDHRVQGGVHVARPEEQCDQRFGRRRAVVAAHGRRYVPVSEVREVREVREVSEVRDIGDVMQSIF